MLSVYMYVSYCCRYRMLHVTLCHAGHEQNELDEILRELLGPGQNSAGGNMGRGGQLHASKRVCLSYSHSLIMYIKHHITCNITSNITYKTTRVTNSRSGQPCAAKPSHYLLLIVRPPSLPRFLFIIYLYLKCLSENIVLHSIK